MRLVDKSAKRRQGALSERAARQLGDMYACAFPPRAKVATLPHGHTSRSESAPMRFALQIAPKQKS
jgi:hypothetical protein